jgi:hypothetical protein
MDVSVPLWVIAGKNNMFLLEKCILRILPEQEIWLFSIQIFFCLEDYQVG